MEHLTRELSHMITDYEKCPDESIKQQILQDIMLLREALAILKDNDE